MAILTQNQADQFLRPFDDPDAARQAIYTTVQETVSKRFPYEDDEYRIELQNLRYDSDLDYDLPTQKKYILSRRTLGVPLVGTWRVVHKPSGAVLGEKEDVVLKVPYLTPRGTFIVNGNEYSLVNQARLRPGVYVRRQKTGEVEAHFNIKPGTGKSFRIHFDPDTGVFRTIIGQSRLPLFPILKAVGVSDDEIKKQWGEELYNINAKYNDPKYISLLYQRFVRTRQPATSYDSQIEELRQRLEAAELDDGVVARTLGLESARSVSPNVLLRASSKVLNVFKGEEDPDDRDAPQFSMIYGVEDLLRERIESDAGRVLKKYLQNIKRKKDINVIPRNALNSYVESLLLGSGLAAPLEETNPLSTLEQMVRITKLGEGGIGSAEAVTEEARDVNTGQAGFLDPIMGPEGMNIGVDVRAAYKTFKGKDNKLYGEFIDARTGRTVYVSADDVASSVVAFPGQPQDAQYWTVIKRGQLVTAPKDEVDYVIPSLGHMFAPHTNLNPMPTAVQAGRQFYGAKFWSQYMPLVKGETPLVDSLMPDGKQTWSEYYGKKIGTLSSPISGVVDKVTESSIIIKGEDNKKHEIPLVKNFPFNRLTGISYFPSVKPGSKISKGDMVAYSNFTDPATGALTLGRNLKAAIIPYKGFSYEDSYVISESAAKKLATERLIGYDFEERNGVELGKNKFISLFPKAFKAEQIEKLDDRGVVRPGTIVQPGDPIILATGPRVLSSLDESLGKLHKVLRHAFIDRSVVWEYDWPGEVTDVAFNRNGVCVNIKSTPTVQPGDKLSTRFGLKGVVGKIIPDDQMPRDAATNEPYEILLNPMAILSRVAPNQIFEMALGKVAKKLGRPIKIPQEPPPEGWMKWVENQLKEAGIKDSSDLFDPETGKILKDIGDGYVYVSAFHHLADKKLSARSGQGRYDINQQPAKGGSEGAKRFSQLDINAALAHGVTDVIKDVITIRGTRNEEFWNALRMGRPLPEPKVPFIYEKFLNTLKAGGINIAQKGDVLQLLPMTDDDVDKLAAGKIENSGLVDNKFEPISGGLFDEKLTGGLSGNRWTYIELPEPIPNPVMEEPIRRVLGLTVAEMEDILVGRKKINGLTGGRALYEALRKIDVDRVIDQNKQIIKSTRGSTRDNAVKVVRFLSAMKQQNLTPDKWMITKVPVLPPIFRPVAKMGDISLVTDLNELYRDIIENVKSFNELKNEVSDDALADERLNIYKAVRAAYGLGDPITTEGESKRLKGAIRQIIGETPKTGLFQSKVISKTVDVVGRGVVTPDPNLGMDQIGIPEDAAWDIYKDFVIRRLVRRGYSPVYAIELFTKRDNIAREELLHEMSQRPVIVDRAPTWHKFNLMAFFPHIVEGKTVRVCPLITKGFNMDFDGDQVNFHVPVSDKAVRQAIEKMLPSKNLISLTDLRSAQPVPSMEMTMGLYWLTRNAENKPVRKFKTVKEAKDAYRRGVIKLSDPIEIERL